MSPLSGSSSNFSLKSLLLLPWGTLQHPSSLLARDSPALPAGHRPVALAWECGVDNGHFPCFGSIAGSSSLLLAEPQRLFATPRSPYFFEQHLVDGAGSAEGNQALLCLPLTKSGLATPSLLPPQGTFESLGHQNKGSGMPRNLSRWKIVK